MDSSLINLRRGGAVVALAALFCLLAVALPTTSRADPTTNIVGGTQVPDDPAQWPYIVALGDSSGWFCGGTLIAKKWVLTAAHCGTVQYVTTGAKDLLNFSTGEDVTVASQIVHPAYNDVTNENDLQLLRLVAEPTGAQPLAIAAPADDPATGATVKIAGWGATSSGGSMVQNLRETTVEIVSNPACNLAYGGIAASMLCAAQTGRDTCQGDSGGPLVASTLGGDRLAGITSFGQGCADPSFPGVYTRVSSFKSWIDGITTNLPVFDPGAYDFGTLSAPATASRAGTITNFGDAPITIGTLAISGSVDFSISSTTCTDGFVLGAGQHCSFALAYSPLAAGSSTGQLTLTSDSAAGIVTADLSGAATSSEAGLPAPALASTTLRQVGKARRAGNAVRASFAFSFAIPSGSSAAAACDLVTRLSVRVPGVRRSFTKSVRTANAGDRCSATFSMRLPKSSRGKRVSVRYRSSGNSAIVAFDRQKRMLVR